jgi:hypothetical protein
MVEEREGAMYLLLDGGSLFCLFQNPGMGSSLFMLELGLGDIHSIDYEVHIAVDVSLESYCRFS